MIGLFYLLFHGFLLFLSPLEVTGDVITAPDKGDELEYRNYTTGRVRLIKKRESFERRDLIDINTYRLEEPKQYVIGLILDPCRNRSVDCCSDRFGDPSYKAYTKSSILERRDMSAEEERVIVGLAKVAAAEPIHVLDEYGQIFNQSLIEAIGNAYKSFKRSRLTPQEKLELLSTEKLGYTRALLVGLARAYTNSLVVSKEKIALVDENNHELTETVSRLGDRPSYFDPDCYLDNEQLLYRNVYVNTAERTNITKVYGNNGCISRLRSLASMYEVEMPACWDRNESINALLPCYAVDGLKKPNCVTVGYVQTGYIAQCFGLFTLSNHCGTFLELHQPGANNETIISQTRILGEYPNGFRTTTLPLFFQGNRSRTVCRGDYEIWWVQRTRYNFIVLKKKKFHIFHPPCDFDFVTNKYINYYQLITTTEK